MIPQTERIDEDPEHRPLIRRVRNVATLAAVALTVLIWWLSGLQPALSLAICATLMIMNFIWLEEIITTTLGSDSPQSAWVGLRIMLRFGLTAISIMVVVAVARYQPVAVLLGFSVVVIGLLTEAVRALIVSVRGADGSPDVNLSEKESSARD